MSQLSTLIGFQLKHDFPGFAKWRQKYILISSCFFPLGLYLITLIGLRHTTFSKAAFYRNVPCFAAERHQGSEPATHRANDGS